MFNLSFMDKRITKYDCDHRSIASAVNTMTMQRSIQVFCLAVMICSLALLAQGEDTGPKYDINVATARELSEIPFIDSKLAESIVAYRDKVGGFVMFEELLQVEGFSRDLFFKVKSYLYLDGMSGEDCGC